MIYSFEIFLDLPDATEEMSDRLYEAGFQDAIFGKSCGRPYLSFDREGTDLVSTIEEAVAQVKKVGIGIVKICPTAPL